MIWDWWYLFFVKTLVVWLWGINLWVFSQSSVSYARVFDLDHTHLTHHEEVRVRCVRINRWPTYPQTKWKQRKFVPRITKEVQQPLDQLPTLRVFLNSQRPIIYPELSEHAGISIVFTQKSLRIITGIPGTKWSNFWAHTTRSQR